MQIDEETLKEIVNCTIAEQVIQNAEDQILHCLKTLSEQYPTKENDQAWLDYTTFISLRRKLANR